jgi:hypothetical protein
MTIRMPKSSLRFVIGFVKSNDPMHIAATHAYQSQARVHLIQAYESKKQGDTRNMNYCVKHARKFWKLARLSFHSQDKGV